MDGFLNRMNYYQSALKRFIQSDRPLMLILGQNGSGKSQLASLFCKSLAKTHQILILNGNEETQPSHLIDEISQHWQLKKEAAALGHRNQLDNLIKQFTPQQQNSLLLINNAHLLSIAAQAALCHLASIQEAPPINLHIILVGEISLQNKISSLVANPLPSLLLQPLNRKETFQYIKHRVNKLHKVCNITPSTQILEKIYEHSSGLPSLINHLINQWVYQETLADTKLKHSSSLPFQRLRTQPQKKPTWRHPPFTKRIALACLGVIGTSLIIFYTTANFFYRTKATPSVAINKSKQNKLAYKKKTANKEAYSLT